MGNLTDTILGGQSVATTDAAPTLSDTVLSTPNAKLPDAVKQFDLQADQAKSRSSFVKGMKDILNTAATGVGYIDKTINPKNEPLYDKLQSDIKSENDEYDKANPPSTGLLPTSPEVQRTLGQTVATLPLMPVRAFGAINGLMGAAPRIAVTGEKLAAPFVNRAAASAVTGGLGGAQFGAMSNSANDEGLLRNTGKGLITGFIAGPVLTGISDVAQKTLPTLKSMWANIQLNKMAEASNMVPAAVKKVIGYLQNAGLTPEMAQAELNKLGPQATLGDLASSLQARVGGLATFDPKAMEIVKGRYEGRAQTANSQAAQIMESKLGTKPNIDAEKAAIFKTAQDEVRPDYKAAYESGANLDISSVANSINDQLKNAVGDKAAQLNLLKGYLYTKDGALKNSVPQLHEVRQAIDDILNSNNRTGSYGANTTRAIDDVRSGVDAALKTNPQMVAADAKFASKMQIVNDIDFGNNALKNGMNKEEFAKYYDKLTPDRQAAVQKGLRAAIGDSMEKASRGELSEAQRLFGKNSANRANLEKVFGNKGTEVLDALQNEAMMRGTERSVLHRSLTAEGQAVQREFGERNDSGGGLSLLQGAALDLASGASGGPTALSLAGRMHSKFKMNISGNRTDRLVQGSADLLSRQGAERDIGVDILNKATKINNLISKDRLPIANLPTYLLSAPIGENGYSTYKKLGKE